MNYKKQTFIDYPNEGFTTLKAEHLNHIEEGIENIANKFPTFTAADFGKQLYVNETGDGFLLLGSTTTTKWENLLEQAELARPGYIAGKGVTQANGSVLYQAASSFYTYINIPIKENTKYYVGGPNTSGHYARFINWQSTKYTGLSADGAITSMTDDEIASATISVINGTGATEGWVSPAGAKFCTISFYDISQGGTETNYLTTIENPADRIDKITNNSIEVVHSGKWNILQEAETDNNRWFNAKKTNGAYQGGGFYTFYNIPITGGTTYYIGPAFNNQYARFINWSTKKYVLDSNGNITMTDDEINSITRESTQATSTETHVAPLGTKYCTVTFYVGYGDVVVEDCYFTSIADPDKRIDGLPEYQVSNKGVSQEILDQINQNTEDISKLAISNNTNNSQRLSNLEQYNFVQTTRKPIINFQFDDGAAGDAICKQIFDEFGYKCDFAVTSNLSDSATALYLDFQNQGFHILSHSTDGNGMGSITDEADKQMKINKMITSYNVLKSKGFDIHGWVTPSSSLSSELYDALASIYDYGFGTGMSSSTYHVFGTEKYLAHMSRVGIESNLILKTTSNPVARAKVITYMSDIWDVTTSLNFENQTTKIEKAPFSALLSNAVMDDYENVTADTNGINEAGLKYLKEIWGVSIEDSTLSIDTNNLTLSLTPTFKICCEREGMKNIREYIDTAISQKAFLSFYAHNTYSADNTENGYSINLSKYTREILKYCKKVGVAVMNSKDAIKDYFSFRYTDFLDLQSKL